MQTRVKTPEPLLRAEIVAGIFDCEVATVRRWARTGVLPVVRLGGLQRFRRSDVEAIIASAPPAPARPAENPDVAWR
jgi:excisionase family DNA binding protein